MRPSIAQAFTEELEKLALDPATMAVALGGTIAGEQLYKAKSKLSRLQKAKLRWYHPRMLAAGVVGSIALGEVYNRYRKKKNRQPVAKRYGIVNAAVNKDPFEKKKK